MTTQHTAPTSEASPISETNARGLGNQAYESLVDLIIARQIKPGDLIQERALALQLGISRTPMREAMHRLEGEGVLERQGNNRLIVRHVTLQEMLETLYVRRLLEGDAAGRAAGKVPRERLTPIREKIQALMIQDDPTDPEHQKVDALVHGLILEASENQILAEIIQDLRRRTRMFSLKRMNNRTQSTCQEHLDILDAIERGNAEAATQAARLHIENIRQALIEKFAG